MITRRYVKRLFGKILTPSYISTIVWIVTDTIEVILLGMILSVVLAIVLPFVETAAEMVAEFRTKRQAHDKTAWLNRCVPFLNAYAQTVTKYPPAMLPSSLSDSLSAQLDIFAHYFRTLKQQKTQGYATAYDLVLSLSLHHGDFEPWDLDDCKEYLQTLLNTLAAHALPAWRVILKRFPLCSATAAWQSALTAIEQDLDKAMQGELCQSLLVILANINPEVHERICTLLKLEAFHRQAALQTYLSAPHFHCSPHNVADTVASLRYDAVATAFLTILDPAEKCAAS